MNAAENYLIQSLTGKPSLEDVSVDELKEITSRFPYFSLGQLLLAKKLKQSGKDAFPSQVQHCAVYFQDITWVQSILYSKGDAESANQKDDNTKRQLSNNNVVSEADKNETEDTNLIKLPAENVLEAFTLQIDDVKNEPELPPLDEEELANQHAAAPGAAAKIADVLQQQVEEFNTPVEENSQVQVSNEPYHTIDYFASQGIQMDTHLSDAFAKKVHTFTDWLKHTKRISNYPNNLGSDPDMESYVQAIADSSNQPEAIDTEAMAEVLVKQGKLEKAIEVYQKLSLLNPGKTAYFAAKIIQLKA